MKRFVCKSFCSFTFFKNTIWNINNISYFVENYFFANWRCTRFEIFKMFFFFYILSGMGAAALVGRVWIMRSNIDPNFAVDLCTKYNRYNINEKREKNIKKHMCLHMFYCCKESKLINMQLHNAKRLGVLGGTMWIKYFAQRWSSSFFCCSIQYPAHGTCHTSCHFNRKGYHPQRIVKPIILTGSLE